MVLSGCLASEDCNFFSLLRRCSANGVLVKDGGCVVEKGKHSELISNKGYYYKLVKNQLNI